MDSGSHCLNGTVTLLAHGSWCYTSAHDGLLREIFCLITSPYGSRLNAQTSIGYHMEYSAKLKIILVLINTAIVIVLVCFWTILAQESQLLAAVLVSSNILGSVQLYTTLVERHERQLAQPQLELAILKPRKYSNEILPSDQREKVQEVWVQSLLVTARNNAIDQLRVKVSVAGGTASYFRWDFHLLELMENPSLT